MEMRAKRDIKVRLKPCPWCKKTPDLDMPVGEDTWRWVVECRNHACKMKPRSPHVSIRNTSKESIEKIAEKMSILAEKWNSGNDGVAFEYKIVDTGPIMSKFKEKEAPRIDHLEKLHAEYNRAFKAWDDAFDQHKKCQEQSKTKEFTMPYRYF